MIPYPQTVSLKIISTFWWILFIRCLTLLYVSIVNLKTQDVCFPENLQAQNCYIVHGKISVIVEGQNTEFDKDIEVETYRRVKEAFDLLFPEDGNVIAMRYIGPDPSLLKRIDMYKRWNDFH